MASKSLFYGILVQCLLYSMIWASDGKAQSETLKKTFIKIDQKEVTLKHLLNEVEKNTNFHFVYTKDLLNDELIILDNTGKLSLSNLLIQVSRKTQLKFKQVNNTIYLGLKYVTIDGMISQNEPQQTRTITGTVTSQEEGEGLPGVNVVEKGTINGTVTNVEGAFSLSVSEGATLVFSSVGYTVEEVEVGNRSVIDLAMRQDIKQLEELVVIGYGSQKRANLTGAVSAVDFEDQALSSRSLSNVSTMLTGMTSGIRVQQINGLPSDNDNATINIRGTGSLNASSSPLVLVDGQVADINSVSPNDVASVSILKDASSAAIYGSRASNGVILITTKSGKDTDGKITFNYNSYIGRSNHSNKEDLVTSTADYMTLINRMNVNSGIALKYPLDYIEEWREKSKTDPIGYPNTNWWDAITKDNTTMNHHLSARGGNNRFGFYSAIEYFDDDGLVTNTGFNRVNFRNNLDYQVNDWLKLGNNITVISTNAEPATIDNAFQWFRATTPAVVPKHPDGRYGSGQLPSGEGGANNMVLNVEARRGETKTNQIQGKIYAIITPLEGLSVTGSFFKDYRQVEGWGGSIPYDRWNFQKEVIGINATSGAILTLSNSYSRVQREISDLYANYTKSIGNHNFHALAGFNQEYYFSNNLSASRSDLLSYDTPVLNAAASNPNTSGSATDFSLRSYFGRLSYNFKDKYLLETNLRYDGSSRFAPDRRWGLFPSLSGGWMISEEEFWGSLSDVVNSFKIRASWGELGNNGIGNYEWQNFYQPANYALNSAAVQGLRFNAFGNPGITWETTEIINVGVDFRLFSTLTFDINYYNKYTHNILSNIPIPMVNGGISAPRLNSAEVRNRGFETEARFSKTFGKLSFNLGGNFAYNNNKIMKYKGELIEPRGTSQAWTEGQPIGVFWVREVDQIVQDMSVIDAMVADGYTFHPQTPGLGDFLYKDNDEEKAINDKDRILKGNPIPLYTYGGNIGLTYGGFDFNAYFDGVGSWDRYLEGSTYSLNHLDGYQWPSEYMDAWTAENPSTKIPKIYTNNTKNNQTSDYFLRSAAYLKIRSMQLGYNLPAGVIKAVKFDQVRFFINMENYFTFTKWPTMDPELSVSGYDQTYPLSKTVSMGVSVSF